VVVLAAGCVRVGLRGGSPTGPTVWVARAGAGWSRIAAPRGRLTTARRVGSGVYLVVDGRRWYRALTGR
jgi:hypothetical protein